jgi:PKD repeat protein
LKHLKVYWSWCVLMILAAPVFATTIVMPTDEQLIAKSPVIVEGTVVSSTPIARGNAIWTETTLSVAKTIKGSVAGTITIREVGGVLDNRITKIFGAPEYVPGEHVLVFLTPTPRGDYQTTDLYVGKMTEERTLDGRMLWSRHDEASGVGLLDSNFNPLEARNVQRDARAFDAYLSERVAGRNGAKNYGIENPVLDSIRESDPGNRAQADFTLISEGQVYRWFTFQNGGSAKWYSYGTQPGYTGGGVNEIQTGMDAWNSYTAAKISYTYAGVESGTPAGLSAPNGVNEVLFNDPLNEISGSWNPSTGGVVGRGGFNGVSGSASWTSPYTFDAAHPQTTYQAYNITEGNLTIQDNVSPSTGISSSRLAEIVAHEFGHTLGFGHSPDSTALMYATLTGLGPSLRPDDQAAARWLYPNGTQPPPPTTQPPAAPTNLTVAVSGTNANFNWVDNANNETSQSIYVAIGSGAFSKIADMNANDTSVTLTGFTAGSYHAYVVSSNAGGTSAQSNTVTFTVGGSITAAFAVNATSGVAGQTTFSFTDQSSGTITSRLWQFGDSFTSAVANPTHVYASAGTYTVSLMVSDGSSSSTTSRTIFVSAASVPVAASFGFTPSNPTTAQDVAFTDQSTGGATSWQWSFGDGTGSSAQNPTKRFTVAGAYTVNLQVSNGSTQSSASRTVIVSNATPATPPVVASFGWTPSNPSTGQTVSFNDASTGSPASWLWSFGDGTSSSAQNPTHVYNVAGAYTVSLTASSATSSGSTSHMIIVAQGAQTTRSLVSAAAQTNGIGGTFWRTELTLFNAADSVAITMTFLPDSGPILTRTIALGPKQSVTYANALFDLFGLSQGAGAIAVESSSSSSTPDVRVTSRTFTNSDAGTYGQGVPDVTNDAFERTTYLPALISNASFRTNIGMVNRGGAAQTATLQLYDANGELVASTSINVAPDSFQLGSLASYFPIVNSITLNSASIVVTTSATGSVSAYASVIDNRTQDPIYIQGSAQRPRSSGTTIAAAGRANGVGGTFWRSDVTLFNPNASPISVLMRLDVAGNDNRNASWQSVTLGGFQTVVLPDIASRFTGSATINGSLEFSWPGNAPVVTSRTYTTNSTGGTFGQSVDPIGSFGGDQYVTGLRSDSAFRTNAGFVNSGDTSIGVNVSLLSSSGATIATGFVSLPPKSQIQYSLGALFQGLDVSALGSVTLQAHTDSAPTMFAYGSIIDNVSGDPVYFGGK